MTKRVPMRIEEFSFGSIPIDGMSGGHGVVIDRRHIHKWNEKPSKKFRDTFGLTPLSIEEDIVWKCQRLVIGIGTTRRLAGHRRGEVRSASLENQIGHIADRCRRRWSTAMAKARRDHCFSQAGSLPTGCRSWSLPLKAIWIFAGRRGRDLQYE
jgi:hypothetical protein